MQLLFAHNVQFNITWTEILLFLAGVCCFWSIIAAWVGFAITLFIRHFFYYHPKKSKENLRAFVIFTLVALSILGLGYFGLMYSQGQLPPR